MHVNATDFKTYLREYLDMVKDEPVVVCKSGKPIAVVLAIEEYEFLQGLEDRYWIKRAAAAEAAGGKP